MSTIFKSFAKPTLRRGMLLAGVLSIAVAGIVTHRGAADEQPNARGHYITNVLTNVLKERITGENLQLVVKPTARADQGFFRQIIISGEPVHVKKLRITRLDLRAEDVRVDVPYLLEHRKLNTLYSTTALRAVVTEDDLTHMLAEGKATSGMGLRVKYIGGDQVRVAGNWRMSWLSGPIVAVGRLQLAAGHKVNAQIDSLKLNGSEAPQWLKNKFMEKINPVIDYTDVPFQPKFKGLKVEGNKAILWA